MSLLTATLGPPGGVAAGRIDSGGLGVALPCASAKRSRVRPEFFDDCSSVSRRVSLRDRAIIREVNETAFALNFLETGGTVDSESCEIVGYSILSTDLAPPALHRLHSVIPDFRPPSVAESGEAALRRLLASRPIGGYSLDPAPGSLVVFQSSRVARPQDASEAPFFVALLSSSARSYLDTFKHRMLRPVSEVADMETRLRPAGLYADPVFQHSWRHCVGFFSDLMKARSVGFVEDVEHVGLFCVAQKAGAERFIVDALASKPTFFETSIW